MEALNDPMASVSTSRKIRRVNCRGSRAIWRRPRCIETPRNRFPNSARPATSQGKKRRNKSVIANMNMMGMMTSRGSENRSPPSPTVTSWSRWLSVK